ncbi:MAG TPA: hypothetical protein VIV59_02260 [Anaeromyxobacteraceae bacterium]
MRMFDLSMDALVTSEHLCLAFHNGLHEDEWFTAVSAARGLSFGV